jgi:hypothetical protein
MTVEQLFKTPEGHLSQLAILVWNKHFQRRLKRIHIDETHFIHTAGLALYGVAEELICWQVLVWVVRTPEGWLQVVIEKGTGNIL